MQSYAFSKQDLTKDLEKIGLRKGDVVLVHSSLSRIGYVPGGAETAIGALLEAVGEGGTIVVPTITGSISDSPENPPSFAKDKPSWTGSVPEALRKMRGAFRSKHPTHSVASVGNL
ncbi:MAG: AAC(3) family N-acetyltransferase, partial [Candidatus Brockarchaeota archaeon]|nr:AAC(3) family N-acetyltransferase [Candidatus Brockarchaeota archaeon]